MTTLTARRPDSTWSMRDARRVYAALKPPELDELTGLWAGRLVGRPRLRRLSVAIAAMTPLRGWCGKRILASGEVVNLVLRHGATRDSLSAAAAPGISVVDGRPALVVDYSARRAPLCWVRGELRWLTPGREVLGLLVLPIASRAIGPLPFVLTPTISSDAVTGPGGGRVGR